MTKQLDDIVRKVEDMSTEELMERVQTIRKNRYVARPAAKQVKKKQAGSELKKLLKGMKKEDIQKLLQEAKGD